MNMVMSEFHTGFFNGKILFFFKDVRVSMNYRKCGFVHFSVPSSRISILYLPH